MTEYRDESDSLGQIQVKNTKYWGAQTQRSLQNFNIGNNKMPLEVIYSIALIKKVAAKVNSQLGKLDQNLSEYIIQAADEIIKGKYDSHFPLSVWQTGSGTQSNMNVNEVIANIANNSLGYSLGHKSPVHPNDHVNMGQSSNDTFPTAMHISVVLKTYKEFLPTLNKIHKVLEDKVESWRDIIKTGRTHLQDATPITLGQEFSSYRQQIQNLIYSVEHSLQGLFSLAQGGTAVGTGINTHPDFAVKFAHQIAKETKIPFCTSKNKFASLASNDELSEFSSTLNRAAVVMMKIANDIRLLGSGPRCGIGEIVLPSNEPGSSIMPGKVNPTQSEAMTMICAQVMGNNLAVSIGASNGHLQLNVFRPLIIHNILESLQLLSDGINSFTDKCLVGLEPNIERIEKIKADSLMLITALNPYIGYDKSAKIAKEAYQSNITLKEAALKLGYLSEEEFDRYMDLRKMI